MAFVFRGERPDEDTQIRATQRLYMLLPNHKCPQKDCPFHPPAEEDTMEEEELPTETLNQPSKTEGRGVEEGGRMLAPPPPPPQHPHPPMNGEEKEEDTLLSDHESVITGDSGVGRERDDFSDGEVARPLSPEPSLLPQLQYIEEDEETVTLTPESSVMGGEDPSEKVEEEDDDGHEEEEEFFTPPESEVEEEEEEEEEIRQDAAKDTAIPVYTPLVLPGPKPTEPSDYKLQVAPEFTAKLKNKRVHEGLSLHLYCSVTGLPEPRVRWLKDGREICNGVDYSIKNNYGLLTLEVARVGSEHGGVYSCEATNDKGCVSCDATITVEGEEVVKTIQVEVLRPRFLTPLQDQVVEEGDDVIMYCTAAGKPIPELKWQKDMLEVSSSSRVTVTSDREGGSTLSISRVKVSDAGLYLVRAKSRSGRCQTTATLRVRSGSGRPKSPPEPVPKPPPAMCASTPVHPKVKAESAPTISLLLPPSLDVHEGDSLRLDCSVQGYPTPIVTWYKHHRGLMYGPRHRILFVGSLHTLHIPQTMALDSGDYIVRAHNHWGTAESVCSVRLLPPRARASLDDVSGTIPSLTYSPQPIRTAPFFTKTLPSVMEVCEGDNFRLDCVLREGIHLVPWAQHEDTGQVPGDTGGHQLSAPTATAIHTTAGRSQDSEGDSNTGAVQENTEEHPEPCPLQFKEELPETVDVGEGESVTLTCTVSQPFARISWLKDDSRLSFDSQRLGSLSGEGGRVSLRVDEVRPSDAGVYRCVATLPDGTRLQCDTRLSVRRHGKSQVEEDTSVAARSAKTMMSSTTDKGRSPVLAMEQERQVVEAGQRAKFKVKVVEGSSPTSVTWSREGQPLEAGSKFKVYEEGGGHCLEVCDVVKEDGGTYMVTVTDSGAGSATLTALLHVTDPEQPTADAPPLLLLLTPLEDLSVVIGDRDVRLKCELDVMEEGEAAGCMARWYHEEEEVAAVVVGEEKEEKEEEGRKKGYRCRWTRGVASLTISQIARTHAGIYRCVVSTAAGAGQQVTTACTLSVREPVKLEPPFFIQELHDMEVEDGDKVELVVEVKGTPPIRVYWQHDNTPVTDHTPGFSLHAAEHDDDDHHHSNNSSDSTNSSSVRYCLVIARAGPQHGGQFVCEAYNQCGDTDSFCTVLVREHADPDPPAFLTPPPPSLDVPEGAPRGATFTCRVKGRPLPAVTWTRQGSVLLNDHRYVVSSEGDTHSLHILNPRQRDEGDYVCHVHNIAGTVTERCSLLVTAITHKDISSAPLTARDNTVGQEKETGRQIERSDKGDNLQNKDSHGGHQTAPPLPPSAHPSVIPAPQATPTGTTSTPSGGTTPTTRLSRASTPRGVNRSPSWHSTTPAFGVAIRVGSVRKRRDWFEQRASESPERASLQGGTRRSALSADRQRQTASDDRTSSGSAGRTTRQADSEEGGAFSLTTSVDRHTVTSREVLAPAIYQFRTVSPSSLEQADEKETQLSVTNPPSLSTSARPRESGCRSYSPHTIEPSRWKENGSVDAPGTQKDPITQGTEEELPANFSADTQRHRPAQKKTDSDGLRTQSPGRMDFRRVLRSRQSLSETRTKQQSSRGEEQPQRTDFRSVLRKTPEKDSTVRRLFPTGLSETSGGKTAEGRHVSATEVKTDGSGGHDVAQSLMAPSQDSLEPGRGAKQSITTTTPHADVTSPVTDNGTDEEKEGNSVVPTMADPIDHLLEFVENQQSATAQATIQLSSPAAELQPSTVTSSHREDDDGAVQKGSGGGPARKTEGAGDQWEAPRVARGLQDQSVCYGGQVVMRCAVSGHPEPSITWTLNDRGIKPSRYFQLSYQEPYAELLVAEAYSEDEGEYTCTATNPVGTDSSSCHLTVEGPNPSSDENNVVTHGVTEASDESSVVTRDVRETRTSDGVEGLEAEGNHQRRMPPPSDAVIEKSCEPVAAVNGCSQAKGDTLPPPLRSDVTGHLPVASDASNFAAAGDVISDHPHVIATDQEVPSHSKQGEIVMVPGRKFEDFYECVREVGRGKFGSVYACREKKTTKTQEGGGSVVAAKVLKVRSQASREDARREVEVMKILGGRERRSGDDDSHHHPPHPTLLQLLDVFEAERSMVLVTEFVGGGELLERVSGEHYELTERDCVQYVRQLVDGVGYMHSRGVLHLDLKPNNVLCIYHPEEDHHHHHHHPTTTTRTRGGVVGSTAIKIIDFGLARFYRPGDSLHVLFGTPEFVAPEVVSYDEIGFGTDLWSVGVMAYILLSGLSPFLGDTDAETLANVTCGEYDFDDDSFDVITEDAKDFIARLLVKRKERRHKPSWRHSECPSCPG
ncbi:uncharacterized protein LOC143292619 isoform X2 [Babylonia areolata]|uniref:uncharacterized protein LOC143292619 isoform X2 n=1 Tax=Babylonia areolata TaxID=304850 RepID=UPI003FD27D2A